MKIKNVCCTVALCLAGISGSVSAALIDLPHDWLGDNGMPVKLSNWRGKPIILTMEYSNCRFICSITLLKLKEIQAELEKRKLDISVLVISIDPDNDTPEAWTQYRNKRNLHYPNWRFLTGNRVATEHLASLLNVKYWFYGEHLMHDFRIVLIAPNGSVLKSMDAYDATPGELLDGLPTTSR